MRVNFSGDICLYNVDWRRFRLDSALLALMDGDLNVCNLESPITRDELPEPLQVRNLRAPPESPELLRVFAAFSLANNHVSDYGEQSCVYTLAPLERAGVGHFALGSDQRSILAPLVIEHRRQ